MLALVRCSLNLVAACSPSWSFRDGPAAGARVGQMDAFWLSLHSPCALFLVAAPGPASWPILGNTRRQSQLPRQVAPRVRHGEGVFPSSGQAERIGGDGLAYATSTPGGAGAAVDLRPTDEPGRLTRRGA